MTVDLISYLQSKDVVVKPANASNIHTACWFHGEDPSDRGRLYINVDPESGTFGLWQCFVCGEKGGVRKLYQHFGDNPPDVQLDRESPEVQGEDLPDDKIMEILNSAAAYYHDQLRQAPEAYDYLRKVRGLSDKTISKHQLGWADGGLVTHLVSAGFELEDIKRSHLVTDWGDDFLQDKIVIPYHVMNQVVQLRGKDMQGKYVTPPGDRSRLFNADSALDDMVVICEGEFDAMVLEQLGFSACGVPGANTWQDHWTKNFSSARRVYVCFDNDQAGRAGAEKVSTKLGPKSRIVEMPESLPGQKKIDISDWVNLHGKSADDFKFLFSKSVGGLLISVAEAFERWTEIEGNDTLEGLRLNVGEIDNHMRHGLLPGQVVTLIAKTGVGKTIISLNLFHRMSMVRPDLKILFVSLEQTRNEWFERAHRIHTFYDPWATIQDTVNHWKDRLYIVDKNRITEDELASCIDQFEYEVGSLPDFVCLDYLGYYSRGFKGEAYERTTGAIMGLKALAKSKQIIIYTPHQVNRTGKFGFELSADMAKESGAVEETSDMMLSIWKPDQQTGKNVQEHTGEVKMKILKSRDGGTGIDLSWWFAPRTLAMLPSSDPLLQRVQEEREYAATAHTWEQVIYRYRTGDKTTPFLGLHQEEVDKVLSMSKFEYMKNRDS